MLGYKSITFWVDDLGRVWEDIKGPLPLPKDSGAIQCINTHWLNNFVVCKELILRKGSTPTEQEFFKGFYVGQWFTSATRMYDSDSSHSGERALIEFLLALAEGISRAEERWKILYYLCKEFCFLAERLPKSSESFKGMYIGNWLETQGRLLEHDQLSVEQGALIRNLASARVMDFHGVASPTSPRQ